MKFTPLKIPDVVVVEPDVFGDARGYFFESFNAQKLESGLGRKFHFVQDNESYSSQGVLRGLHYQINRPQGKLVRVSEGAVFDVAVDLRGGSTTFGSWVGCVLSQENKKQLWIPEGFAHGFLVLSEYAKFLYKVTDFRSAEDERCIVYDDRDIGIDWQASGVTLHVPYALSDKDRAGSSFAAAEKY